MIDGVVVGVINCDAAIVFRYVIAFDDVVVDGGKNDASAGIKYDITLDCIVASFF